MKTQEEFIKEILNLKTKNPDMEIVFFVKDEMSPFPYTKHQISKVKISDYWDQGDDQEILTNEQEIKDELEEQNWCSDMSDTDFDILVDDVFEKEVKKVILVYTDVG